MHGRSDLQLQWNLDRTVHQSLDIALEFVAIATRDNVQPIALAACEHFGITLPICRATRLAVERDTKPRKEPIILRFASAVIKKAGGEALKRLSSNVAGLDFLALAAALKPAIAGPEAGAAIQMMLDNSASDKSLVPPEHHIEDILKLLEPQLQSLGFLDRCYGWHHWLRRQAPFYDEEDLGYPSPRGMELIVSSLRKYARLGDERVNSVIFTCHSCAAWVISFVEWCLGISPTICSTTGFVIYSQPESGIAVHLPLNRKSTEPIKAELFQSSGSLLESILFDASQDHKDYPNSLHGMVSIQVHAQRMFQVSEADSGLALRAMVEGLINAIPCAMRLIIPMMSTVRNGTYKSEPHDRSLVADEVYRGALKAHFSNLFPDESRVYATLCKYLERLEIDVRGLKQISPGTTGMFYLLSTHILRPAANTSYLN